MNKLAWLKETGKRFMILAEKILFVFMAALVLFWTYGIYTSLDEDGYISHSVEGAIQAQPSWLIGETKTCFSVPNRDIGFVAAAIDCDGGPYHTIKIRIFGRREQPEYKSVTWRCKRETDSFTCWQTGAD